MNIANIFDRMNFRRAVMFTVAAIGLAAPRFSLRRHRQARLANPERTYGWSIWPNIA